MIVTNCFVLKSNAKVLFNLQYMNCGIRISNRKSFPYCLNERDDVPDDSVIHTMQVFINKINC